MRKILNLENLQRISLPLHSSTQLCCQYIQNVDSLVRNQYLKVIIIHYHFRSILLKSEVYTYQSLFNMRTSFKYNHVSELSSKL